MIPYTAATAPPATAATARPPHTHHPTGLPGGGRTLTDCAKLRPPAALVCAGPSAASCRLLLLPLLLSWTDEDAPATARGDSGPKGGFSALLPLLLSPLVALPLSTGATALPLAVDPVWNHVNPVLGLDARGEEPVPATAAPLLTTLLPLLPLLPMLPKLPKSGVEAFALGEDTAMVSPLEAPLLLPLLVLLNNSGDAALPLRGERGPMLLVLLLPLLEKGVCTVLGPGLGDSGRSMLELPRAFEVKLPLLLLLPPLLGPLLNIGRTAAPSRTVLGACMSARALLSATPIPLRPALAVLLLLLAGLRVPRGSGNSWGPEGDTDTPCATCRLPGLAACPMAAAEAGRGPLSGWLCRMLLTRASQDSSATSAGNCPVRMRTC